MNKTTLKTVSMSVILAMQAPTLAMAQSYNGVPLPKLNWSELRDIKGSGQGYVNSGSLLQADRNKLAGKESEVALASGANRASETTALNPSPAPLVFGTYNQYDATLRVDAVRLEKVNGRTKIYTTQIDPTVGDYWKAAQTYADPSNKIDTINPFDQYKSDGSRLFHNVSTAGAGVILSHAAQLLKAPVTYLGIPQYRGNFYLEKQGKWYGKKLISHYQTYAAMEWYQGSATSLTPDGVEASVCAEATNPGDPCPIYRKVPSFVRFKAQSDGTYPSAEVLLADRTESKRDFGTLIMIGAFAMFAMAPYYFPPELMAVVTPGTEAAAATYAGCYVGCTATAMAWNDNQVDKFQENAQKDMVASNRRTDSVITLGVQTPIAASESLTTKQKQTSPLFPSQRAPSDPGSSKLNQYGFEEMRNRTAADPFRGSTFPQTARLVEILMPEAFIERKLTLDNLQLSNKGYDFSKSSSPAYTSNDTKNGGGSTKPGGGSATPPVTNPQKTGTSGTRQQIN